MEERSPGRVGAGRLAVLYARAPDHGDRERTPVEDQLVAARALAAHLGYEVTDEATFSDSGPNTSMSRPGMSALLGLVAQGRAAAVITYTLDRLARHESKGLDALLKELRRREVPIYLAKTPGGYEYDPATGTLVHDPEAVAAASREDARPPEFIIIPSEDERDAW